MEPKSHFLIFSIIFSFFAAPPKKKNCKKKSFGHSHPVTEVGVVIREKPYGGGVGVGQEKEEGVLGHVLFAFLGN